MKVKWKRAPIQELVHKHVPTSQRGWREMGPWVYRAEGSTGDRRSRKPERSGRSWTIWPKMWKEDKTTLWSGLSEKRPP